jgi:hypothetical protein
MRQKESNTFTGFIAHYPFGAFVIERENYFSKALHKPCATNWAEIDKKKLMALELQWHGKTVIEVSKSDNPEIGPDDWFFTQSAIYDMKNKKLIILARNIGYKTKDKTIQVYSVEEATGRLVSSVRAQPQART